MVAAHEILPSVDLEEAIEQEEEQQSSIVHRLRSVSCACNVPCKIARAHADVLDTTWLAELDRLGTNVFVFFMLLRSMFCRLHSLPPSNFLLVALLSLSILWGFLLVIPFWCISLISNERFIPSALQTGLVVTFIVIIEPVPFVVLMNDARSKIYHVISAAYLILAWREVCLFLVPGEALGQLVARSWVRNICFTVAGASVIGCGAVGWTIWEGAARRLWVFTVIVSLLLLQAFHQRYKVDN
jgi:hypothetical protein